MKLLNNILFTVLLISVFSCEHTVEYFEINDSPQDIDFTAFHLKYVDNDSVHIVSNEDFYLDKMSVKEIIVYERGEIINKTLPTFTKYDSVYIMYFEIPLKSSEPFADYRIYFNMIDNTFAQVDTTITFLTSPTAGATIEFVLRDIPWAPLDSLDYPFVFLNDNYWNIDAFDISENSNYWVFRVGDYFFGWDRNDNTTQYLDVWKELPTTNKTRINEPLSPSGNDVVFNNNVLFFDSYLDIRMMDYNNDTYTYFLNYQPSFPDEYPHHLSGDSQNIYVSTVDCWIKRLDPSATLIDKIKIPSCYGYGLGDLEVYNNILYVYFNETHKFLRYDLDASVFLPPVPAPANYLCCGFRIKFDRVYYIDWGWDQDIGRYGPEIMVSIPLSSFLNE